MPKYDLKVEAHEFVGSLNPKTYLEGLQGIEKIFDLKGSS